MTISAVAHLLAALDEELAGNEAEFARLISLHRMNSIDIARKQGENEQIFRELQVLFAKQTAIQDALGIARQTGHPFYSIAGGLV